MICHCQHKDATFNFDWACRAPSYSKVPHYAASRGEVTGSRSLCLAVKGCK